MSAPSTDLEKRSGGEDNSIRSDYDEADTLQQDRKLLRKVDLPSLCSTC